MKKEWKQPELTVLLRTRAEEAILGVCKNGAGIGAPGLNNANSRCLQTDDGFGNCVTVCSSQLSS